MICVKIKGATEAHGEPDGWDPKRGRVETLPIRRESLDGVEVMLSAWKPSQLELEMLNTGGSVVLGVVGRVHPPVYLYVSKDD